jgi:hypothetical protein
VTNEVARQIAEEFVSEKRRGFVYECIGVRKIDRFPNELNVSFQVTSAEGIEFEGPVVVIVNEQSKEARFF